MNMQNKLYRIHSFSPSDDQFAAGPQAVMTTPGNSKFCKTPKKD